MKKDQMLSGRRAVLRLAAALGATATVGALAADRLATPDPATGPAATPRGPSGAGRAGPAAGPQAHAARLSPSAYRLQPMTEYAPPAFKRALPPVRRRPFLSMSGVGRSMVLTFDDGPDPRYTPGILETLRHYDCRAMFFVCGEMAVDNQDLLREMQDDGHVVGNHSWSHPLIPKLRPSRIRQELGSTSEVIEKALGAAPLWYRAPYGAWNRLSFEIGAELGMEPLAWTVDTLDWTEPGTGSIVRRVLDGAAPGVVVLSHDAGGNRSQSVAALRRYLPELLDAGYQITVPRR
ncbi:MULTISPECIES: polysaccharide deacetylase family protein [Streptomyces]|jgi:peptidoglycan-N-acetylglucosamine deacetylase|uniref:Peptidoglycan/xylan/chitin deacetylase (PgdA/CDA1 family) n=1 Tax=Streptomyces nymphaeiformis TaxID=2663842 RepID=A0A7W7U899_9ACTN|nr:polysaccharide deacetylase family protein [Streptomyces nymphaeiformis]MBB4986903.1 peptidoglycan/xylan/chitin deacetylase (PgdA/CDA1 family) [Streptomyces nymphaeiformis]